MPTYDEEDSQQQCSTDQFSTSQPRVVVSLFSGHTHTLGKDARYMGRSKIERTTVLRRLGSAAMYLLDMREREMDRLDWWFQG